MSRRPRSFRILALVVLTMAATGAGAACAQLIGADFDVRLGTDAGTSADGGTTDGGGGGGTSDAGDAGSCVTSPCVVADHLEYPWDIAVLDGYVYWTVGGSIADGGTTGSVMRAPTAGGPPETLATDQWSPNRIATSPGYVYWTNTIPDGGVLRIATTSPPGAAEELANHVFNPIGLAVDATNVYWTAKGDYVFQRALDAGPGAGSPISAQHGGLGILARDSDALYYGEYMLDGGLFRLPLDGGPEAMVTQQGYPNIDGLAIGAVGNPIVYFTTNIAHGMVGAITVGEINVTALAPDENQPAALVLDGNYLYWPDLGDGTIRRIDIAGGTPQTIASGQHSPNGIAVDANYVYWTNHETGGAVMKIAKPQ